ncbi:MAG: hypothetical protein ABIQ95_13635, partial [Bdellovibrionia bacterium]
AISAQAVVPTIASKSLWLDRILQKLPAQDANALSLPEESLSLAKLRAAMGNYTILGQEEFTRSMMPMYFQELPKLVSSGAGIEYAKSFSRAMYPSLCDSEVVERTSKLLADHPNLPAAIIKTLKVKRQEESRCIQIRKNSVSTL